MQPNDMSLIKESENGPFEKSVNAFIDSLSEKRDLSDKIKTREEFNKILIDKYKNTSVLSMSEAEELAGSSDEIESLNGELKELTQRHKDNENALSIYLQKIEPKKLNHIRFGTSYELGYGALKGVMCREINKL